MEIQQVLDDYRLAVTSRKLDETELRFASSGRAKFAILSGGNELALLAAGRQLKNGDWIRGYYRCLAAELLHGIVTPRNLIAQVIGDTESGHDDASGGHMMGRHFASRLLDDQGDLIDLTRQVNRAADSSPTGSQMGIALGLALASKKFKEIPELAPFDRLSKGGQEVALVSIGDSSMAEGISWESINQMAVQGVPVVISVLDNGYGISVTRDKQMTKDSISAALSGMHIDESTKDQTGIHIIGPVDGWDYVAVNKAYEKAFAWTRETGKPSLVHVLTTQPFGHSSSGDHTRYKSPERLQFEKDNDPIKKMREWIIANGHADEETLAGIETDAATLVKNEADAAWEAYYAPIRALAERVTRMGETLKSDFPQFTEIISTNLSTISEKSVTNRGEILAAISRILIAIRSGIETDTKSALRDLRTQIDADGKARYSSNVFAEGPRSPLHVDHILPEGSLGEDRMPNIIAAGLASMMKADPRIVVTGEDVGKIGGVIAATRGLQGGKTQAGAFWDKSIALRTFGKEDGFGEARVWDWGIAEASIIGAAIGMATRGLIPAVEIQYEDYVIEALQQMADELASLRHRTDGGQEAPMLIRTHGNQLLGMWHSGSWKGMFLSACPGLRILVPRNAVQAVGMYRAVLKSGDPAFSIESLMSHYGAEEDVPRNLDQICIPLGHSEVLRSAKLPAENTKWRTANAVTIVTYGYNCNLALEAAKNLADEGIEVEVVDLQTLEPIDVNGVAVQAMLKTSNVLFLDEDLPNGAASMIGRALLNDRKHPDPKQTGQIFEYMDKVDYLSSPAHRTCYGADGKTWSKPSTIDIEHKVRTMLDSLDGGRHSRDGQPRAAW